jgi:hypothetical protein
LQSITSIWIRIIKVVRGCFVLASLLFTLIFISCADGMAQSDQVLARGQKVFFEAWVERELSGDELRKVTDEFIVLYTKMGKNRAGIHEAIKPFLEDAKILGEQKGTPREILLRHDLLEANYFNNDMQNTTELRLLTEPDPVLVVDPGGKGLMTKRDVVALANLSSIISNSGGEPRSQEVSRKKIDAITIELDRAFGNHPNARQLPRFFRETAALWAGIQREWSNLSAEQKRQVRAYVANGYRAPMDDYELYGKLLDLNTYEAFRHWQSDSSLSVLMETIEFNHLSEFIRKLNNN